MHAPFSWPLFIVFAGIFLLCLVGAIQPRLCGFTTTDSSRVPTKGRFPAWGWFGLVLMIASWVCAWGRFAWLGFMRDHMFAPLWFGFVFSMDGFVHKRTGRSLLARSPRTFVLLFPLSAVSWWYFEYLNRFVRNWWYAGIGHFGPGHYVFYSLLCYSTVLPAIFESAALLLSFEHFRKGFLHPLSPRVRFSRPQLWACGAAGVLGLGLLGAYPDPFFYMTWLAPIAILYAGLRLARVRTPAHDLARGDFRLAVALAGGALVCGIFWEMWNYFSLPKWHYAVPYVNRWHVFEMPMAGYGGYLPFGPLCFLFWLAWKTLLPESWKNKLAPPIELP
jgi:hypothetical protein